MGKLAVWFALAAVSQGSDWTRFRGPNGTGVSADKGLPSEIGREKNVIWKIKTPKGNSSPAVAEGRLWITGFEGDERYLLCYSAANGEMLWRRAIPKHHEESPNPQNGPTTPSPVVGERAVFAYVPELGLIAFDFDGKELWRAPMGPFGGVQGMAVSPVYAEGKLVLLVDTPEQAFVAAWDARTGKQAWKTERPIGFLGSYATPSVHKPASGATQLIVSGAVELTGYDLATGKRLWWLRGATNAPATLPLVVDGSVYTMEPAGGGGQPFKTMLGPYDKNKDGKIELSEVSGDRVSEKIMYRLFKSIDKMSGNGDGVLIEEEWERAFNPKEPPGGLIRTRLGGSGDVSGSNVAWKHTKGLSYLVAPILYQNVLYVVRTGGILSTFDPETGKLLREERLKDALGDYWAQPVAGDGKVYFVSKEGKIRVVRAGADWEVIGSGDLDEPVIATPAIAGSRIYIRAAETLYCFGSKS